MNAAMAFCASLLLAGMLLGEIYFGATRSEKPAAPRDTRMVRTSDRKPSDDPPAPPPDEPGAGSPDAGKPAPLQPRPGHHLVAANSLPPKEDVYLLPKD